MKSKQALTLFLCLLSGVAGYGQAEKAQTEKAATQKQQEEPSTVTGSIFIVTKAAENMKLGLVTVRFYEDNQTMTQALDKVTSALKVERDNVFADYKLAAVENLKASRETEEARLAYVAVRDTDALADEQKTERLSKIYDEKYKAYKATLPNFQAGKRRFVSWMSYAFEQYSKCLPNESIYSAKSDADGKFSVSIPKNGRFLLAARAERVVSKDVTEHYCWLLKMKDQATKQIMLSNDNLFETKSPECAVLAPLMPEEPFGDKK